MAELQLVDYIKKARQAGQADDQSRALLAKNGWTESEVNDAFLAVNQPQQAKPEAQPQAQFEPQIKQQPKPQYQPKPEQNNMPQIKPSSHLALKFIIVFSILVIIAGAGYFTAAETGLLQSLINAFSPPVKAPVNSAAENNLPAKNKETAVALNFATKKLAAVLQDYDVSKITVYSFSQAGDEVAYCLPLKNSAKIDCFLNNQKLDNPYSYKPYWISISPDKKRIVSFYSDLAAKKAFIFENGKEGERFDGTIGASQFSNDSQNFLYIVNGRNNKSFVVLDAKAFAPHDKIYGIPSLSLDKKYILYGARDGQDIFWVADATK